jgi:hypothetical protein
VENYKAHLQMHDDNDEQIKIALAVVVIDDGSILSR